MRINYKHSEQTKEKIRQRALGHKRCLGKKHSQETKDKISLAKKGVAVHTDESREKIRKATTGKLHTEESKEKMRQAKLGKPRPEHVKQALREFHTGLKPSAETRYKLSLARAGTKNPMYGVRILAEKNHNWKGDDVGYSALHSWVRSRLPKPELCQICEIKPAIDLANMTGIYNRDLKNWKYLCKKCHFWYDTELHIDFLSGSL